LAIYAIGGLVSSAVGIGMQYSAQKKAAANEAAMANYNYAVQEQNIKQQQALAQHQADYQARTLEANAAMARQQADANASAYEMQADATLRQGMETASRTREDRLRHAAIVRARISKSGVAEVGSPVETLTFESGRAQMQIADEWAMANLERSRFLRAAEMERYGGSVDVANYGMQAAMSRSEGATAPIKSRMALREANYNRLAGLNMASGKRSAATAGLVSGFGTVLSQGYGVAKDFA
jgi:hypothetical protein